MSDIPLHGLLWFMVALGTMAAGALGVVGQPLVIVLVRRGRGWSTSQRLGTFVGPLLAGAIGLLAAVLSETLLRGSGESLDAVAWVLPAVAIAVWIAITAALLR